MLSSWKNNPDGSARLMQFIAEKDSGAETGRAIKKILQPSDPAYNSRIFRRLFYKGVGAKNHLFSAFQYRLEREIIIKRRYN
jgi:hypothetical protein